MQILLCPAYAKLSSEESFFGMVAVTFFTDFNVHISVILYFDIPYLDIHLTNYFCVIEIVMSPLR